MNKFGKVLLCLSIPVLLAGTGCGIYYGIQYHNLDKQVVEDDSGMVNVVDELRKSVESLEKEKATLTKQLSALQSQYDALNQLRQNLESTNSALETENAELQLQFAELNNQNAQLETQITNLNNQITSLNTQIETLNKTLADNKSASDEEIASLELQVVTLQAQYNSLNSQFESLNNQIDDYEANTIALNTQIANLNNTIAEYEQEIENYKQIIEDLKKINSCVVTFIVDGELYNTQQVDKTESPVIIDAPESDNYIFDGWTVAGSTDIIDPFTYSILEDVEFVASIRKYKVITFTVDDEVVSTQRIFTYSELEVPIPEKAHYTFLGWSLDGENIIDLSSFSFTTDVNLIAIFEVTGALPYTFDGETLTSYSGTDTEIVIPTSYSILEDGVYITGNDYQVSIIGDNAFKNNTSLTSITLNDNITRIGSYAFYGCSNLRSFIIPDSVVSTGNYVFQKCSNLTSIVIGEKLTNFGIYSLYDTPKLKEIYYNVINHRSFTFSGSLFNDNSLSEDAIVYIGSKVNQIPTYLFYKCSNLNQLIFKENSVCDTIGDYAFYGCSNLSNVSFPSSIITLGSNAFASCLKFSEIIISENIQTINDSAFWGCKNVNSIKINAKKLNALSSGNGVFSYVGSETEILNVIIGKDVESIPDYLFMSKYDLDINASVTNVVFEENSVCKSIGKYAFGYLDELTEFNMPNSIETVGENAFYKCSNLVNISISNNIKKIEYSAFTQCASLVYNNSNYVNYLGNAENPYLVAVSWTSRTQTSYKIEDSCVILYNSLFNSCSNMSEITISNNILYVGKYAFSGCSNLVTINYKGSESEWNNITVLSDENSYFINATINYNYSEE